MAMTSMSVDLQNVGSYSSEILLNSFHFFRDHSFTKVPDRVGIADRSISKRNRTYFMCSNVDHESARCVPAVLYPVHHHDSHGGETTQSQAPLGPGYGCRI